MDALLLDWVDPLFSSTWIYPIVVAFVALDGVLPVIPGEGVVITAAVLGSGSQAHIAVLMLAALCGSVAGDTTSYGVGRLVGAGIGDRFFRSGRRAAAHRWATDRLDRRGGVVLIGARFLPGGRTATTLCAGTLRYPFRRFIGYTTVAGAAWSAYTVCLGVLAGGAFTDRPLQSVLLGVVSGVGLSMCFEVVRRVVVARRNAARAAAASGDVAAPAADASVADASVADASVADGGRPAGDEPARGVERSARGAADDAGHEDGESDEGPPRDVEGRPILLEPPAEERE